MIRSPDADSRQDTMWFLLPSVMLGTIGVLAPFSMLKGGWSAESSMFVAAVAGLAGVSAGLVLSDGMFPDGRKGWGRVASVWLGVGMYLPAFVLGKVAGRDVPILFAGVAVWVMWSSVLFADLFRLSAVQSVRFAARFHGLCAVGAAASVLFPEDVFPWFGTAALLVGGFPAAWINRYVRAAYPLPPPDAPPDAADDEDEGEALRPTFPAPNAETESDPGPAWPAVPPQTAGGERLFLRWLVAVAVDEALIFGWLFLHPLGIPGLGTLIVVMMFGMLLFYQPVGERLGGTVGQRLAGIRLIEPGYPSDPPSVAEVGYRHVQRIAFFWGILSALLYWMEAALQTPEERVRMAQGADWPRPRRGWMFIER